MEGFACLEIAQTQAEGLANCAIVPLDEAPPTAAREGRVLVDIRAVSLNMPDLLLTVNKFTSQQEPPFVLGREGSGVVVDVGSGCTRLAVGDRVRASILSPHLSPPTPTTTDARRCCSAAATAGCGGAAQSSCRSPPASCSPSASPSAKRPASTS